MMYREPEFVPLLPGVFALVNKRRRLAYVSWTQNLQKRSHSMSHMLLQYDNWLEHPRKIVPYWPIRGLPKRPSAEFMFIVETPLPKYGAARPKVPQSGAVLGDIARVQKKYAAAGYKIVKGHRAASRKVVLDGKAMTLAEAVRDHSESEYLTVYRRLERGWTLEQALGRKPPAPRWRHDLQQDRKVRAKVARGKN